MLECRMPLSSLDRLLFDFVPLEWLKVPLASVGSDRDNLILYPNMLNSFNKERGRDPG